jgi:hypothetical protein
MALDKKIMDRVLVVAGVIKTALQDIDTKGGKALSITRPQLSELIGTDFQFDRNFLLHTTEELAKNRIHLTSVMSTDSKVDFVYYAAFATNPFYSGAIPMKDKSMKRLEASATLTLESVLELTKFGLTESALAHFTCSSIGHSSVLLATEAKLKGKNVTTTRCLRCDRKLTANDSSIVINLQKNSAVISAHQLITWRDVVHCQASSLYLLDAVVGSGGLHKHLEIPFVSGLLGSADPEKKTRRAKQDKGGKKPVRGEKEKATTAKTEGSKSDDKKSKKPKQDKPASPPKALL